MKFVSSVAALLLLSSAATYADTPDILGSVSKDSVQVMAKDDMANTRGEYRACNKTAKVNPCGEVGFYKKMREYNTNLASLKYLRTTMKNGRNYYVAR